ncbi:MAG: rod shape-determining protein MreD [Defluviitaleaceae bacterium]|nr:rod shape-determining protein MreD [Defluviitaleaceae bacterium]
MRTVVLFILILVNFTLQSVLFPNFAIMGVTPDTALILIICYAILRGEIEGAIFGFVAGLVQDILFGPVIGVFALLGFLTGYICGKPFRDYFKNNYFLPFVVVVVVGLIYQFVLYVGTVLFFGRLDIWLYMRTIIIPKTIYTASLSIPLYSLLHFINKRIERFEEPLNEI